MGKVVRGWSIAVAFCDTQAEKIAPLKPSDLLAAVCLSFGLSLAALTPASLQHRLVSALLCGLIPAVVLFASGYIPAWGWAYGCQLIQTIVARSVRGCMFGIIYWASRLYFYTRQASFKLGCLMIRSTALFIIRMQAAHRSLR